MKETKFKQTEVGMIPRDWDVAVLGKITTHVDYRGKTPKKKPLGIQLITAKNIRMGYIDYKSNQEFVSEDDYLDVMKRGLPQKGDVLITTEAPCGYVAQIDNEKIALAQRVIKYRGNNGLINDYLSRYFQSELFQNILASLNTGGTVQGIKGSVLHTLPVVLPKSTEEQQRIANALSDIDTLIANLEKLIAKKKNIKQGAMQQLLTGRKRLPGFGSDERREMKKGNRHCEERSDAAIQSGYKMTELGMIPSDWEVKTFGDVGKGFSAGATPYRQVDRYYEGDIKWVSSGELDYNVIQETQEHISIEAVKATNLTLHPKNTFLMAITGLEAAGTRGRCAILGCEAATNQSCLAIYESEYLSIPYLYHFYVKYGDALAFAYAQGSKQQSFTAAIVKKLPIILPSSKAEQTAIANILSDMDTEISALETKLAKYRTLKTGMMQQLLTGKIRLL